MYLHLLFLYYLKCWKTMRYIKFGKWKIIPTGFLFNSYSLWKSLTLHANLKCRLIFRKTVLIPSYLPICSLLQTHWLLIHSQIYNFFLAGWLGALHPVVTRAYFWLCAQGTLCSLGAWNRVGCMQGKIPNPYAILQLLRSTSERKGPSYLLRAWHLIAIVLKLNNSGC